MKFLPHACHILNYFLDLNQVMILFFIIISFFVCKKHWKNRFLGRISAILKFLHMNFIGWGLGYSYCRINLKLFALSVSDSPSWRNHLRKRPTYFSKSCLLDFSVHKNCVKSTKKGFSCILRVYLSSPTSFILIFKLATSKKILKNSLMGGGG